MTITPTAPAAPNALPGGTSDSATAGANTGGDGGAAAVPGGFVALVQQALTAALGGAAAGTPTPGGPAAPGSTGSTTAASKGSATGSGKGSGKGSATDGTADQGGGATTAVDAALVAAANGLPGLVAPVPATPAGTAGAPTVTPAAVTGGPAGQVTAAGGTAAASGGTAPSATIPTGQHAAAEGKATAATVGDGAASAPAVATALPGATHPGGEAGTSADPGTGQQPSSAAPTTVPTAGPVVPTHAPATAPAATGAPPAPAAVVTSQVFPEVTSLASRGDGTHRITLTLKPEALGEVRVVMTVRDGAVHVRLAAGHEAQQALLSGSSELSRLLEHAGATDTRIVVRDLGGTTAPTTGTSNDRGADLGQSSGFSLGAGEHRSTDQHAGTRADHYATDGGHDTTTAGTTTSRPVQPATRTRTAGVDVTM